MRRLASAVEWTGDVACFFALSSRRYVRRVKARADRAKRLAALAACPYCRDQYDY